MIVKSKLIVFFLLLIGAALFAAPLKDIVPVADSVRAEPDSLLRPPQLILPVQPERHIIPWRLAVYSGIVVSAAGFCYSRMDDWWGNDYGPFHIKHDDWNGDNLIQTDEISHIFVSYRITQATTGLANWSGIKPPISRIIGGCLAGSIMLFVEYPVDAHNPVQGFGYSDMIANSCGITFALARNKWPDQLSRFDIRFSIKSTVGISDEIIAQTLAQNDNYIYWLTVNPLEDYPFHFGVGYSANHDNPDFIAEREIYLGFGTSLAELAGLIDTKWERDLQTLSFYELSFNFRIH
ncbi:DUF2279 domain-containing protein [bacterium]|nr:DUF2279 domain-containing protein [bacterium]